MAAKVNLVLLPPFNPLTESNLFRQRWKTWTKSYVAAINIIDDKQKGALLFYQAGPATKEFLKTLLDTVDNYKTA